MLSIYASKAFHETIHEIIQREDRLGELVRVVDFLEERPLSNADTMVVKQKEIWPVIDWYNLSPPYLLPEHQALNPANLLGMLFARLNNYEKVQEYLAGENPNLQLELDFIHRLQLGVPIDPETLISGFQPFDEYRLMHNQAVVHHYAAAPGRFDPERAKYFYLEAFQCAPNAEYRAFTARQFANLLIDESAFSDAERLLKAVLNPELSAEAANEIRQGLCQIWLEQLTVPVDNELLNQLKETLWAVLKVYEQQGRSLEEALVLTDAGRIAHYSESWSESLGYFTRAQNIFSRENMDDLSARNSYYKGIMLYSWAKKGNPQFFRPAAESLQWAVQYFRREDSPTIYADIQHHLGIIYAEIPDEVKKKGIWAGVSSSAFQEALSIYSPERYPYEYAMVCNHYGNALTNYPEAKLSDNIEKALWYYQEALRIRTAETYPTERCLTLLNYLEAQWHLSMPEDTFQVDRYEDMCAKAEEVLDLSRDPQLQAEARQQLHKLEQLRLAYA